MSEPNNLSLFIDELGTKFDDLKVVLDKYPLSFSLNYSKNEGYILEVDEDFLNSDDPIELSKHPFSAKQS